MPSYIFNKKQFINWLNEGLEEDDVIIFSDAVTNMTANKKGMKFNFDVSSETMKERGDVGKFYYGKARAFSILKISESDINEKGFEIIENQRKTKSYGRNT